MGAIVVFLAIIGFLVFFAYLKFPPLYAKPKLVSIYNQMVMAVCAFLCLMWFFSARADWMGSKLWMPIAVGGAIAIEIVFLGICFLLRNFWIFKPPRRPGSGMFGL